MTSRTAIAAAALALLCAGQAKAEVWAAGENCNPLPYVVGYLSRFGEQIAGKQMSVVGPQRLLFFSPQGTWTIGEIDGDKACLREAGIDWELPTTVTWPGA